MPPLYLKSRSRDSASSGTGPNSRRKEAVPLSGTLQTFPASRPSVPVIGYFFPWQVMLMSGASSRTVLRSGETVTVNTVEESVSSALVISTDGFVDASMRGFSTIFTGLEQPGANIRSSKAAAERNKCFIVPNFQKQFKFLREISEVSWNWN